MINRRELLCQMKQSLLQESRAYFTKNHITKYLLILEVINAVILSFVTSQLYIWIVDGNVHLIKYYIGTELFSGTFDQFVMTRMRNGILKSVECEFIVNSHKKYDSLSFTSKITMTPQLFREKMTDARYAINAVLIWGLPTVFSLCGTCGSVVFIFYQKNLLFVLICSLLICGIVYTKIIKKKQDAYMVTEKERCKTTQHNKSKIQLMLIPFQYKEITPEAICEIEKKIIVSSWNSQTIMTDISGFMRLSNQLVTIAICMFAMKNLADFLVITLIMTKVSGAITSMTYFITQYTRMKNDYANWYEFWKDAEYVPNPDPLQPVTDLKATSCNITKGNFKVTFDKLTLSNGFSFGLGVKILIQGTTGQGKTTFLDGLLGKIDGINLNIGRPENYYHSVADMFQTVREKMPSSKITIRNFFKDELNDNLIEKCLLCTFEKQELEILKSALSKNFMQGPYDVELDEILSGGQKSRLCLATRCYEIEKFGKKIFALDEPEQGSDPETAISVIQRIFTEYSYCSIIMVSHMCSCSIKQLDIKWDLSLRVENGIVSRL